MTRADPFIFRTAIRLGLGLAAILAGAWVVVAWTESEKEIRILCSMFRPGTEEKAVVRTLETGNLLRYRVMTETNEEEQGSVAIASPGSEEIFVDSPHSLGTSRCTVAVVGEKVRSAEYAETFDFSRWATWVGVFLFGALAVFQGALAAGAPLGRLAWGGQDPRLPRGLRWASAVSAAVALAGGLTLLEREGVVHILGPPGVVDVGAWLLVLLFLLSTLGNLASQSIFERRIWTPVAFLLAMACLSVALAG
jgi:hypothetical protein